ncbi:uncharacterized protein GGS22DRAFT_96028 [Annulohypoxylon maeteangense]|uniref:uncharacterized protein n=1 Tax=Annulohypoxylon maeteangense TaxID=1927788 RepID=UPI0020088FF4|nr:uncharacterized protein GGS22DRAFT_96028 [Annulohypoxylon maeteangense]KAI0888322.1 hypothetical protein GGS22DRAFT_96028 [Annulohypoxylon maeteangense]
MTSLYDTRYFIPQWDEQMLGLPWREERIKWDFDNPPKPLPLTDPMMQGAFKYCEHCQLTWLVGHDKLEGHHHPHHLAWDMGDYGLDAHRYGLPMESSLVIFVHGASIAPGKPSKSPVGNLAGVGIFFGEGSKYNQALPCGGITSPQDAEMAELTAVDYALAIMKTFILDDRKELLLEFGEEKREAKLDAKIEKKIAKLEARSLSRTLQSDISARAGQVDILDDDDLEDDESDEEEDALEKLPFRVIIVSDKIQVVDNVCKHYKAWTEEDGKLVSKKGKPIQHGELYQNMIFDQMEEDFDVFMKWYHVPKDQNGGAVELAKDALEGKFVGFGVEWGFEAPKD